VLFDKLAGGTKDGKILRIIPGIAIKNKKCEILVYVRLKKYARKHIVKQKALKFGYIQRHDIHIRTHEN
jgi:hypothetical protein